MSDHLSDQDLKRLSDLAALRDRGVLSEEEFQRAKQRLLEGRASAPAGEAAEPSPRRLYRYWLPLTLVSLVVLLLVLWFGVMRSERETEANATGVDELLNETAAPLPGPELCSSDAIYAQIADAVFDRAVQQYAGDSGPLTSLRRAVGVRMQYPVLRDVDSVVERTDCSGRLVIDIPPDARDEFEGATALQADVDYSIQPAAEGGGALVELNGTDVLVHRLVAAATLLTDVTSIAGADGAAKTYNPSFDCGGALSNVERMICQDEELSARDRALSTRYRQLQSSLAPADRDMLAASQRRFLEERSDCPDPACLASLYATRVADLARLAEAERD